MGAITVGELGTDPKSAIARIESGETLQIMRNGRSIAEMRPGGRLRIPVRDSEWHAAVARLKVLVDQGMDLGGEKITHEDKYGDAEP